MSSKFREEIATLTREASRSLSLPETTTARDAHVATLDAAQELLNYNKCIIVEEIKEAIRDEAGRGKLSINRLLRIHVESRSRLDVVRLDIYVYHIAVLQISVDLKNQAAIVYKGDTTDSAISEYELYRLAYRVHTSQYQQERLREALERRLGMSLCVNSKGEVGYADYVLGVNWEKASFVTRLYDAAVMMLWVMGALLVAGILSK